MKQQEREALETLRFDWAATPDDVWQRSPFHVDGLHNDIAQSISNGIEDAQRSNSSSPIGIALQGQRGAGKTHLLGWVRQQIQSAGGYFFLAGLLNGNRFWESTAIAIFEGLTRTIDDQSSQLAGLLERLSHYIGLQESIRRQILGEMPLTKTALDNFISTLRRRESHIGRQCQDTARALALCNSLDLEAQDIGQSFLMSMEEGQPGERMKWGIQQGAKLPMLIVKEVSRLLALTGPSVIAIDQIDTLVAQSMQSLHGDEVALESEREVLLLEHIAGGLMDLREVTRRTLSIVACLPNTWVLIKTKATDTVGDRFREALTMRNVPSPEAGQAIIAKRFSQRFKSIGYNAPYPTWPIKQSAFDSVVDLTPRALLRRVDEHVSACLRSGVLSELDVLSKDIMGEPSPPTAPENGEEEELEAFAKLDEQFEQLKTKAKIAEAFDSATEDKVVPALLSAGFAAWIAEGGKERANFTQDPPPGSKPSIHARLRQSLNESTEDEIHWAFRAISSSNANATLNRIRAACTTAGLDRSIPKRKLFLLRNGQWSKGARTKEVITEFESAGGVTLPIDEDDFRTFAALKSLSSNANDNLKAWLALRQPAGKTKLLRRVFEDQEPPGPPPQATGQAPLTKGSPIPTEPAQPTVRSISLGTVFDTQRAVSLPLEALRKHTAIFAGSGSGKTVLIRRIIEECALHGVSAIVLDPNNDLARLGDAWPQRPEQWPSGDDCRARQYLRDTDVAVWTPRREAGRPLSFQPLPDFASVIDDADEFSAAIDVAVAALAPRARLDGDSDKAVQGQAVLREALRHFAKRGGQGLKAFIQLLVNLPEGVSELDKAEKIAGGIAQTLTAAVVNDPLLGGGGAPMDPALLLTPPSGKKTRISVISFVGLPSDQQRQSFVNQLQMALFAWIKKNPAGERPLGALFVMDEAQTFAPSGAMTACTFSTLTLASQARKYGLGLVFATQAPKGIHNRIPGNAATQFFGFLNSPIQIAAAKEMAEAKGGHVPDISRLRAGQFYAMSEAFALEKIQTPLCLSYHPKSALTAEEVIQRARKGLDKSEMFGRPGRLSGERQET